jgi:HEAT repeat protein
VPALVNFLGQHAREDLRLLCLTVLGRIGSSAVVPPIIDRYLHDVSENVRQQALAVLPQEHFDDALPILVGALKSELNLVVRRAAVALGHIGDPVTIPALIDALVTSHRYKVQVPAASGITIGYTPNGQAGVVDPRALSSSLPPEVAGLARTGQLPYGATVTPAFANTRVPKVVTVRAEIQNQEVLAALEQMTGQNLGYNEREWQLWHALNKS